MNSAEYVDQQIQEMKASGMDLSLASWKTAQLTVGWPYVFGGRGENCTPGNRRVRYNKTAPGKNKDNIKAKCQVLNGSKESCTGCKWYPNGKRVKFFDCRGFDYWILLQIYGWKLEGVGCTSQWNNEDNWQDKGEIADGIPQNVIVCVYYYKKEKGKRTKTLEHTGLYYNGSTIECSNGVEYSATLNKKWDVWGVPACVKGYTPGPTPPGPTPPGPEPVKKPTIRRGDRGPYVKECQEELLACGYDVGKTGADGIFGKNTEAAVKKFQKEHRDLEGQQLKVDGIVGQKTWGALDDAVGKIETIEEQTEGSGS